MLDWLQIVADSPVATGVKFFDTEGHDLSYVLCAEKATIYLEAGQLIEVKLKLSAARLNIKAYPKFIFEIYKPTEIDISDEEYRQQALEFLKSIEAKDIEIEIV